ncbi:hypothetical protein ABIF78_007702 [Bradyrhizobium japonicum]|jgi:hypothetical protein
MTREQIEARLKWLDEILRQLKAAAKFNAKETRH